MRILTAEDADALVVASASLLSFESWCEWLFVSVLSSDSRGDRGVVNGVPGVCFCNWLNCVCTCVACFSSAAATASLCFFNSDWLCRSCARISRSNSRASRASRSLYTQNDKKWNNIRCKRPHMCSCMIKNIKLLFQNPVIPSNVELQVLRA